MPGHIVTSTSRRYTERGITKLAGIGSVRILRREVLGEMGPTLDRVSIRESRFQFFQSLFQIVDSFGDRIEAVEQLVDQVF